MKKKILLVDDDAAEFGRILPLLLSEYEVRFELDIRSGILTADAFEPDLFLLDMMLPDGTGLELATSLRADPRFIHTPIIFVTGVVRLGDEAEQATIANAPAFGKPVDLEALRKCVEEQLGQASSEPVGQ